MADRNLTEDEQQTTDRALLRSAKLVDTDDYMSLGGRKVGEMVCMTKEKHARILTEHAALREVALKAHEAWKADIECRSSDAAAALEELGPLFAALEAAHSGITKQEG